MKVLISVTHLLGVGHLNRAAAIGRALAAAGHAVTLVSGGPPSPLIKSEGLAVVQLPPVRIKGTAFSHLLNLDGATASPAHLAARRDALVATLEAVRPQVVVTELFPFGRRALAAENLALLAAARALTPRPLIVSSVRDVLAASRRPERIAESHERLRENYDAVLVHGDPAVLPLEASWPLRPDVALRLNYTGYIDDAVASATHAGPGSDGTDEIIVSGGGSAASLPLYRCAIAAASLVTERRWRLLVGAGVTEDEFAALAASAPAHVVVERARRDFPALLARAAVTVSQFGYNTAVDLLRAGTRAVVVPFEDGGETEQRLRAERFAAEGLVDVLPQEELSGPRLAATLRAALHAPPPRAAAIDRNGLARTVAVIEALAAAQPAPALTTGRQQWQPLDEALRRRADRAAPLQIWWRDDDAVAPTPALDRLLELARRTGMPLGLAVIPGRAEQALAERLAVEAGVDVLVHGYGHVDHAPAGEKKAEFGAHRPVAVMRAEAAAALGRMRGLFGDRLVSAFVPPWNRIAGDLAAALPACGYSGLSTFGRRRALPGLAIANCHCDPIAWHGDRSLVDEPELIARLARHITDAPADEPIGLLTHHLVHDAAIWRFCEALLGYLTAEAPAAAIVMPVAARAVLAGGGMSGEAAMQGREIARDQ